MGTTKLVDELTPIASYMAKEMNTNALGADCKRMAGLNAFSSQRCIDDYLRAPWWQRLVGIQPQQCIDMELSSGAAALLLWTSKVMQDADWDHKPKLRKKFLSPTTKSRVWHTYGATQYYYDIWSNIHYGYVGAAAGFSESVLLDGAGLEQIGSDLLRQRWPKGASGVTGLRRFDDFSDRAAIAMGLRLYPVFPGSVSASVLLTRVLATPGLSARPGPRQAHVGSP